MENLRAKLLALDAQGYKAYKSIQGQYRFAEFRLSIDHVQGDPFATPSRISIQINQKLSAFPATLYSSPVRRIALEDFLGRAIKKAIDQFVQGKRGSGGSGEISIATSGQEVLRRNAVLLLADGTHGIEARLSLGLPANKRRAAAGEAIAMFFEELPRVVSAALRYQNLHSDAVRRHVESVEDQQALRECLQRENLVAFVADGSILPRASGVDNHPLQENALPLRAPDELARSIPLPNVGEVRGLAIPKGISLIVGGGFHGKSTLLQALERGVYNHIPGDGRECVATVETAVKIRAEDGRAIAGVDISPFINNLPFGRDTSAFSSDNGSGSTSQAANIIEALECGTSLLLMDEDTSATNFMIRDQRMQALVASDKEPITPLIHRVRDLYEQLGVSSIIVMGGCGDYFDVADNVIMMDNYQATNMTQQAKKLAESCPKPETSTRIAFKGQCKRKPQGNVLSAKRGQETVKIATRGTHTLLYGEHQIDLSQVEQLIDMGQTRSIGLMIHYYAQHYASDCESLIDGLQKVLADSRQYGLDHFSPYKTGDLALPRLYELAAAINRIREGLWR